MKEITTKKKPVLFGSLFLITCIVIFAVFILTNKAYASPILQTYPNGNVGPFGAYVAPLSGTAVTPTSDPSLSGSTSTQTTSSSSAEQPQMQGIFVAGRNFIIQGNNDCTTTPDLMLNMAGIVIVNAMRNGGTLINERDLCRDNPNYPSFTIEPRYDFIFNLPLFISEHQTISSEVAP